MKLEIGDLVIIEHYTSGGTHCLVEILAISKFDVKIHWVLPKAVASVVNNWPLKYFIKTIRNLYHVKS